jgi:hypothetical protein
MMHMCLSQRMSVLRNPLQLHRWRTESKLSRGLLDGHKTQLRKEKQKAVSHVNDSPSLVARNQWQLCTSGGLIATTSLVIMQPQRRHASGDLPPPMCSVLSLCEVCSPGHWQAQVRVAEHPM